MTSKELVYKTLEFKNTDGRAPRELWTLPWAADTYPEEYEEILRTFSWDIAHPHTIYQEASPVESGNSSEIGDYTDPWGCIFTNIQKGVIGEVKTPLVSEDDEDWEDCSRIHIPEEQLSFDISQVNEACASDNRFLMANCCPRPFEQLQFIRSTELLYMDLILKPKGLVRFMEQMHDFYCRLVTKWAQTDVDGIMFMDDWGTQKSLLISPQLWCELFKPMYRDYINIAKKYGKKTFMHSDGYTLQIIPHLIELGLDAFNTQIFCMGPENLRQFRGKITFWGEICRQHILPHGTPEDVFQAVKAVYDNLWQDGGCIAQCEFGPGAKPQNVTEVYRAWDKMTAPQI